MSKENINVYVRLKPTDEIPVWRIIDTNQIVSEDNKRLHFTFDKIHPDITTQEDMYQDVRPIVASFLSGVNGTIMAYGQTASGKTYTMQGDDRHPGIIQQTLADIFTYINTEEEKGFVMKVSYIEIYNEKLCDLLMPTQVPVLYETGNDVIIWGLTERKVNNIQEAMRVLRDGQEKRRVRETELNELSSRSHTLFRIYIERVNRDRGMVQPSGSPNVSQNSPSSSPSPSLSSSSSSSSQGDMQRGSNLVYAQKVKALLYLVDLAGSESAQLTKTEGEALLEGRNINTSLLSLGKVMEALSKERGGHINYRDSKLTHLLKTNLSGNSKIAVICTINPSRNFFQSTRQSLLFAENASKVKTHARVNVVVDDKTTIQRLTAKLKDANQEIMILRKRVRELEDWVNSALGGTFLPPPPPPSLTTTTTSSSYSSSSSSPSSSISFPTFSTPGLSSSSLYDSEGRRRTFKAFHAISPARQALSLLYPGAYPSSSPLKIGGGVGGGSGMGAFTTPIRVNKDTLRIPSSPIAPSLTPRIEDEDEEKKKKKEEKEEEGEEGKRKLKRGRTAPTMEEAARFGFRRGKTKTEGEEENKEEKKKEEEGKEKSEKEGKEEVTEENEKELVLISESSLEEKERDNNNNTPSLFSKRRPTSSIDNDKEENIEKEKKGENEEKERGSEEKEENGEKEEIEGKEIEGVDYEYTVEQVENKLKDAKEALAANPIQFAEMLLVYEDSEKRIEAIDKTRSELEVLLTQKEEENKQLQQDNLVLQDSISKKQQEEEEQKQGFEEALTEQRQKNAESEEELNKLKKKVEEMIEEKKRKDQEEEEKMKEGEKEKEEREKEREEQKRILEEREKERDKHKREAEELKEEFEKMKENIEKEKKEREEREKEREEKEKEKEVKMREEEREREKKREERERELEREKQEMIKEIETQKSISAEEKKKNEEINKELSKVEKEKEEIEIKLEGYIKNVDMLKKMFEEFNIKIKGEEKETKAMGEGKEGKENEKNDLEILLSKLKEDMNKKNKELLNKEEEIKKEIKKRIEEEKRREEEEKKKEEEKEENEILKKKIEEVNKNLQIKVKEKEEIITSLQNEIEKLQKQIEQKEKEKNQFLKKSEENTKQKEIKEEEFKTKEEKMKKNIEGLTKEVENKKKELEERKREIEKSKKEAEEKRKENDKTIKIKNQLEVKVNELNEKIKVNEDLINEKNGKIKELEEKVEEYEKKKKEEEKKAEERDFEEEDEIFEMKDEEYMSDEEEKEGEEAEEEEEEEEGKEEGNDDNNAIILEDSETDEHLQKRMTHLSSKRETRRKKSMKKKRIKVLASLVKEIEFPGWLCNDKHSFDKTKEVIKLEKECWVTVGLNMNMNNYIYLLKMAFTNGSIPSRRIVGIIPYTGKKHPDIDLRNDRTFYGFDLYMGKAYAGLKTIEGNAVVPGEAQIIMKLNMEAKPHTLTLYVNGTKQPKVLSGFGDNVMFIAGMYFNDSQIRFTSLKKVTSSYQVYKNDSEQSNIK